MKKRTSVLLFAIPVIGTVLRSVYDPMLGGSLFMENGMPQQVVSYMNTHPDVFITKKLLKDIMSGKVK